MKLIICPICNDVFQLRSKLKFCECGYVYGKYIDDVEAQVSTNSISMAIGNGSLYNSIMKVFTHKDANLDRNEWIGVGNVEYCWVRPNEGEGNPHTKVVDYTNEEIIKLRPV